MITGIQHFSWTVSNLEESVSFFRDILGLEVTSIREGRGNRAEKYMQIPGARLRIANVITPDFEGGNIELIEYTAPESKKIDMTMCNPGMAHIGLEVDDLQKTYDDFTLKGVEILHPPLWHDGGVLKGWGAFFFRGPDGITMEVMQRPSGVGVDPATGFVKESFH